MTGGQKHQENQRSRLGAASTLSKPFKSPLRTRNVSSHTPTPTRDVMATPKDKTDSPTSPMMTTDADPFASPPSTSRSTATAKVSNSSVPRRTPLSDPELVALQKEQRSLESRIATLRDELDKAKQALRIETSNKATELETLIIKWRLIGQSAADEVFASAQERVTSMGGVAAWRERSKQDAARWAFEDEDPVPEDEDEDEDEVLQARSRDASRFKESVHDHQDAEAQEEEFTMEFMLKTLNIKHQTIGYDAATQQWA